MATDEIRDLQERIQLIHDMTETPGWSLFIDAASQTMLIRQSRIVRGKCETQEDYRAECAFIEGIEYLINLPKRLQSALDNQLETESERVEDEEEALV